MRRAHSWSLTALLTLAACASPHDEVLRAQLRPYIGQSLVTYLSTTGDTPSTFYDLADGRRSFVFERTGMLTLPGYADPSNGVYIPAATTTARCVTTVVARRVSPANSPDSFVIESLTAAGNC